MANLWERRENESAKAFEAFELYRGLGPTQRTTRAVGKTCGKSASLIERWCTRFEWVARARAWDQSIAVETEIKQRAERVRDLEAMRERHRVVGRLALARASAKLAAEDEVQRLPIRTVSDVATPIRTGMALEKSGHALAAAGYPQEPTRGNEATKADEPVLRKLVIEIIGDGGKVISGDDLAQRMFAFYDKPTRT